MVQVMDEDQKDQIKRLFNSLPGRVVILVAVAALAVWFVASEFVS